MLCGRGDGVVDGGVVWCSPPTPAGPSALKLAWQAASTLGVLCVWVSGGRLFVAGGGVSRVVIFLVSRVEYSKSGKWRGFLNCYLVAGD